jgi:hypothetical protein
MKLPFGCRTIDFEVSSSTDPIHRICTVLLIPRRKGLDRPILDVRVVAGSYSKFNPTFTIYVSIS